MIDETLKEAIAKVAQINVADVELEHPADLSHGDYSTNIALKLSKEAGKNPKDVAHELIHELEEQEVKEVKKIEVAGPGFINFYLSREFFSESVSGILDKGEKWGSNEKLSGKKVMVEYTDPNPFKEFHIGHLMSNAIGESISRVVEFSGAETHRANYQGDLGVHVASAVWGKQQKPDLSWGEAYAYGASNYKDNKNEIDSVNKKLYERSDEGLNALYDEGRKTSLEAFETVYKVLGTKFDHYFFEGEAAPIGMGLISSNKKVFEESDGAVVFRGEERDPSLHTRVFVNSQGLPTYEAKELGLAKLKFETWPHDHSIVITANEIEVYYKVVMKALKEIEPKLSEKIHHVSHGFMRLPSGKMSSRTGDVVTAMSLIDEMKKTALQKMEGNDIKNKEKIAEQIAVSAIKYSILKQASGRDIIFDMEKALSFEGDSGPYLQYSYTRTQSLLSKAEAKASTQNVPEKESDLERLVYRFEEVVARAVEEYEPHYVTTYLTELAGAFNSWYAKERVIGNEHEAYMLSLVSAFALTMKNGLWLLGIEVPEKM